MSEESMVELVQDALAAREVDDEIIAAGQFYPRGHSGALFLGGFTGGDTGKLAGGLAESVGVGAGSLAGMHAADAASGLPAKMLVGVSATTVYGFAAATRRSEPTALAFQVPRERLTAKVHQRVNVRVLELVDDASGSRIELEGSRVPLTHSKDVIQALSG
jgi:hypothetical protein